MPNKPGRPVEITDEKRERIVKAIEAGNYIETAAAYAGIHKDTLYAWLKRGAREKDRVRHTPRASVRKEEQPFVVFSDAVKSALANAEIIDVARITQAASLGAWQAAAWRLERKFPDRWGRKKLEISGPNDGPIQHEVEVVGEETKEQQFERLFAAIDEYRADVDVPDSGLDTEQSVDTHLSNGKAT